jgi:hypothetical protein
MIAGRQFKSRKKLEPMELISIGDGKDPHLPSLTS